MLRRQPCEGRPQGRCQHPEGRFLGAQGRHVGTELGQTDAFGAHQPGKHRSPACRRVTGLQRGRHQHLGDRAPTRPPRRAGNEEQGRCATDPPLATFLKCFQAATSRAPEGPPPLSRAPGDPGLRMTQTQPLKGSSLIPQRVARSQPQPEDSASSNWASASPHLEVAPDKLGHGVVVDVQGQRDPGLSLKPGSPHRGHPGHLARPEACGQRRP